MKKYIFTALVLVGAVLWGQRPSRLGSRLMRPSSARPAAGAPASDASGAAAQPPVTTRSELRAARGTNGTTRLVFNQTPLELVLESYAQEVGRTILPAPDLPKVTITLRSAENQALTKDEYLFAIEHILTMNGVVLEPRGEKFLRALARKTVRQQGIPLRLDHDGLLEEKGRVVSQLISFRNIAVSEAQKALEGFKDPSGLFQVFERTNAILVTDTQENINRMLEVAKQLDIATPVLEDVFVRQIKFAAASEIKTALETIVTESQKESQAKEVAPKTSGAPGFGVRSPGHLGSRLLNLNNRPGVQQPPAAPAANETMLAAVSDADRGMIRGKVLILADERSNKLIVITMKSNMDFFDRVIETLDVETEPEFKVEVVRLKYAEAEDVESMLNDLIGGTSSSSSSKENKNQNAKTTGNTKTNLTPGSKGGANAPAGGAKGATRQGSVGDLNKDNCKVLADKRINGIVVMTRKELMPIIMQVIDDMDVKLSQVLIETVIIQVELGDDLATGVDWVQKNQVKIFGERNSTFGGGGGSGTSTLASLQGGASSKTYSEWAQEARSVLVGGKDDAVLTPGQIADYIKNATAEQAISPMGGGINYFLRSDKLNIDAVISASKSDSRTKVLASPILMTVDNKEATIEATDMIYLFSGYQYSGSTYNGTQVRNYEKRDIGLTVKVTPKINPNGTVMLSVEEKIETQGANQAVPNESGGTDDYATVTTRKLQSDIAVENRQTIVMGGLTKTTLAESESGIPILKDLPYIGRYLFGSTSHNEKRSELLVFMTPYVLDNAESAQMEALRRKKVLSDARAWDDNGWSASPLADPVSQKEQLRRFKDEWQKQDEERKSKLAIEKAKVDRAKKLKAMSQEEREFWLKLHKEELEKEAREEFDKKVQEQKDLKAFVETLKQQDLEKAEREIE